ncbi:MAG TPA: c(7)-type cytochrome triheme domain-containing protein [Bryobacteraceae bacterium]|nr:c(7)-type cytochrome triheme domain-containing protein [Bryobacteraceae bacterium]
MRKVLASVFVLCLLLAGGLALFGQEKKAADKLTFTAKNGNVTFDHAAHAKREKNDCKVCHDKLWPQSKTAPLNWKAGMHKPAETAHTSCGACHFAGGAAFETKGNCTKCHVKSAA